MLDPWIIEEIRRREERERRQREQRPVLELPLHPPQKKEEGEQGRPEEEVPRGIAVIDLLGE